MTNQCFISSYRGDFPWLQFCLRSLHNFSEGFLPPVISVSLEDAETARFIVQKCYPGAEVVIHPLPPPHTAAVQGFGMMRAMNSMMHADVFCPKADNIFLVGSDCLATRPFRGEDYVGKRGEPVVLMNSYEEIKRVHPDALPWRDGTAQILGFTPPCEYMRRLPSVFAAHTFFETRKYIADLHGKSFVSYWFDGYAAGQRGQSEANLLGAIAHRFTPNRYTFQLMDGVEQPPNAMLQMWSHGGLDHKIDCHYLLDGHDVFGMKSRDAIVAVLGDCNSILPT